MKFRTFKKELNDTFKRPRKVGAFPYPVLRAIKRRYTNEDGTRSKLYTFYEYIDPTKKRSKRWIMVGSQEYRRIVFKHKVLLKVAQQKKEKKMKTARQKTQRRATKKARNNARPNATKFFKVIAGKTLKQIYKDKEVLQAKQQLRASYQKAINDWATRDKKMHIPVYVSLKPKMKENGKYFAKRINSRGVSIVIFPIRMLRYPAKTADDIHIRTADECYNTLKHEYAHHLAGIDAGHGKTFKKALTTVAKRD